MEKTRREFLVLCAQGLAGITITGFVASVVNSCSSATDPGSQVSSFNITVDVSSLTSNNQALRTSTPDGHQLLVVREATGSYLALLLVCTHQGCSGDSLQQSGTSVVCSCHGAEFNLQGKVIRGPASTDLTTYPATYDASTKKVTIHN